MDRVIVRYGGKEGKEIVIGLATETGSDRSQEESMGINIKSNEPLVLRLVSAFLFLGFPVGFVGALIVGVLFATSGFGDNLTALVGAELLLASVAVLSVLALRAKSGDLRVYRRMLFVFTVTVFSETTILSLLAFGLGARFFLALFDEALVVIAAFWYLYIRKNVVKFIEG